jgi:hypothetical protein
LQSYNKQKVANSDVIHKPEKIQKMALPLEENIMDNHSLHKDIKESNRNKYISLNAQPDKAANKNNNGKELKKSTQQILVYKNNSRTAKTENSGRRFSES